MPHESYILLIAIIGLLVVIVAVLLWAVLRYQRKLSDKDDAIIRGIRENIHLHDELQRRLSGRTLRLKYQPKRYDEEDKN